MKMSDFKKRVKGFTLTEMVVVLAIIGILTAVLTPTMTTYYWKGRVRTANANAKLVYNAAQSGIQRCMSADKVLVGAGPEDRSPFDGSRVLVAYDCATGTMRYSVTAGNWSGGWAVPDTSIGEKYRNGEVSRKEKDVVELANTVLNTVSDASTVDWAIYVSDYIVEASVSAHSSGTDNIGSYSVEPSLIERYSTTYGSAYNGHDGFEALLDEKAGTYASATINTPTT